MKNHPLAALMIATLLVTSSGCATLFKSKETAVSVSSAPDGAEVFVDGTPVGKSPMTVTLSNKTDHEITFKTEDGKQASCRIAASASGGWVVLSVLAGGVGWIVDWATGNWRSLDRSECRVTMQT